MPALTLSDFKDLLETPTPAELGPGPRAGVRSEATVRHVLGSLFRDAKLSGTRQQLVTALLLLWHDHMDASHGISQDIASAEGSFVHGILHRREPDYGNAHYWFRRVGHHPVYPELGKNASGLPELARDSALRTRLVTNGRWDPAAMIAACEEAAGSQDTGRIATLRELQRVETETLLNWILTGPGID